MIVASPFRFSPFVLMKDLARDIPDTSTAHVVMNSYRYPRTPAVSREP